MGTLGRGRGRLGAKLNLGVGEGQVGSARVGRYTGILLVDDIF